MPQADYLIDNGPGAAVRQDINTHLQAIVTQNSGPTEPKATFPGMFWLDTSYGVNGYVKIRNQANDAWIELFDADRGGFLAITGGTMTGDIIFANPEGWSGLYLKNVTSGNMAWIHGMGTSAEHVNEVRFAFVTPASRELDPRGIVGTPFVFNLQTGTLTATGDLVAFSDRSVKENIRPIVDALDRVLEMKGVWFDHLVTGRGGAGLVAQDLEQVAPELVTETDGKKGVNYGGLTGYLVEAIRSLEARVALLEKELRG